MLKNSLKASGTVRVPASGTSKNSIGSGSDGPEDEVCCLNIYALHSLHLFSLRGRCR